MILKLTLLHIFAAACLAGLVTAVVGRAAGDVSGPEEKIRIALVRNVSAVTVDAEGLAAFRENGRQIDIAPPVVVRAAGDGLLVQGVTCRKVTFSAPAAISVNGKPYRGRAEITAADKGLLVINELPLEEYLVGLINCEISSSWPIEAVKAQAVIARTYALNRREVRKNALYHLESSVLDQVYDGCEIEDNRARRAVQDTSGQVLTHNGAVIQAYYHSNCGGRTEASENVWGARLPYLAGVDCVYCLLSPSSYWEYSCSLKDIEEKLRSSGMKIAGVTGIRPGNRNSRGRLKHVVVTASSGDVSLAGDQFRKAMGYSVIKSTSFTVDVSGGAVVFTGVGNGHGVGLCQWGAKQRALDGFSYTEILAYYYPGTRLKKFSEIR